MHTLMERDKRQSQLTRLVCIAATLALPCGCGSAAEPANGGDSELASTGDAERTCFMAARDVGVIGQELKETITLTSQGWAVLFQAHASPCYARSVVWGSVSPSGDMVSLSLYTCDGTLLEESWQICGSNSCREHLEWGWDDCQPRDVIAVVTNDGTSDMDVAVSISVFDPME